MFAQIVELQLSLAEPLDQFLRRGGHPVADVTHVNPLLLAEHIVEEELLLDLRPLQKGVVHALWASQRPAVPAFALAVMLGIVEEHVGSGGVEPPGCHQIVYPVCCGLGRVACADIELAVEVNGSMGSPDGDSDDAGCLVDVDS